jgi:hypothetical protein
MAGGQVRDYPSVMSERPLDRTPTIDLASRHAIANGERVLTWSKGKLVELILDEQDRLIEIPRPDLVRAPQPSWRERLASLLGSEK